MGFVFYFDTNGLGAAWDRIKPGNAPNGVNLRSVKDEAGAAAVCERLEAAAHNGGWHPSLEYQPVNPRKRVVQNWPNARVGWLEGSPSDQLYKLDCEPDTHKLVEAVREDVGEADTDAEDAGEADADGDA